MANIHRLTAAEDIEQQAADWLIRLDGDRAPSAAELEELKAWMQRSPAHKAQLKRLTQYWHRANLLTELSIPLPDSKRPNGLFASLRYQFRQLFTYNWQATTSFGAALTLTVAVVTGLLLINPDDVSGNGIYETRIGEQNSITLVDGSVIQLNTDSHIQVNYEKNQRNIVLMAGEAHFEVAKDPSRPFVVKAGDGMVRAVGTAFTVRINPEALKVIVTEGKVALAAATKVLPATTELDTTPTAQPQTGQSDRGYLVKGQSVDFNPQADTGFGNQIQQLKEDDLGQQLAWRKGLLLFAGEPLSEVIDEVNRYTKLDIQIIDPEIADISIGGQFKVGEIETMLKVLETSFGINVNRPSPSTAHLEYKKNKRPVRNSTTYR